MDVETPPGVAFGRREPASSPGRRKAGPAPPIGRIVVIVATTCVFAADVAGSLWAISGVDSLNGQAAQAERQVIAIVNQPVTRLSRTDEAGLFSPGWFHPGATRPDFGHVDIRTTQTFPYDSFTYVTSDLNPSEMFIGNELEFNSMTKYFYTDRSVPKRRLSDAEMIEINGLYDTIGREQAAVRLRWFAVVGLLGLGGVLARLLSPLFRGTAGRAIE